jgi:hypothetical protein
MTNICLVHEYLFVQYTPGADPGFQVRRGALKKIAPSRGRRNIFSWYDLATVHLLTFSRSSVQGRIQVGGAPGAPSSP